MSHKVVKCLGRARRAMKKMRQVDPARNQPDRQNTCPNTAHEEITVHNTWANQGGPNPSDFRAFWPGSIQPKIIRAFNIKAEAHSNYERAEVPILPKPI